MAEGSQPRKRNLAGEAFKKNYDALRDALAQSDLASVLATELHSETIIAVHTRDAILACSDSSRVFQLLQAVECTIESDHRRLRKFVRVLKKQPDLKPIAKQLRQCYSKFLYIVLCLPLPVMGELNGENTCKPACFCAFM